MIKYRIFDRKDIGSRVNGRLALRYSEDDFYNILNGKAWDNKKYPPFRDAESVKVINEIDKAKFVKNEWYAMITPFGKTCLSALSSGSKYALTVINNSKHGIYTTYGLVGSNVWELLAELDMDILLALDEPAYSPDLYDYIIEECEEYNGKKIDIYVHNKDMIKKAYVKEGVKHLSEFSVYIGEKYFQ